jgi:hypothetical protein
MLEFEILAQGLKVDPFVEAIHTSINNSCFDLTFFPIMVIESPPFGGSQFSLISLYSLIVVSVCAQRRENGGDYVVWS